jgi:hypothetical protein
MVAGTRFLCIDTLTSPDLLLWDTESGSISAIANPGTGT